MKNIPQAIRALLRATDMTVGRALGRRRVLVDSRTPMNLAVLAPVWRELMKDPRVSVSFSGPERADLKTAFEAEGITRSVVTHSRARVLRWDLLLNADPWDPPVLWRCRRRINFFHGVAGKYNLECPRDLPLDLGRYDRIAFPNAGRMQRYIEAGLVRPERAALVGFPKLDAIVNARVQPATRARELGLSGDRPTVIYAPTFSPESSLQEHGEGIVSTLLSRGFAVIVKLHDRSLDPDPRYSGGHDWRARFARFAEPGRFLFATTGDATDCLLASDLMITDHSTIGFEFCALDRPLIVFDTPRLIEAARIDAAKVELLRSAADVVSSTDALPAVVDHLLRNPRHRRGERAAAVSEVFHDPGYATARAVSLCYELLESAAAPSLQGLDAPGRLERDEAH